MGAYTHLPFALTKLGETVEVTPEADRAEALTWAHARVTNVAAAPEADRAEALTWARARVTKVAAAPS
jgi:hypothetical protein